MSRQNHLPLQSISGNRIYHSTSLFCPLKGKGRIDVIITMETVNVIVLTHLHTNEGLCIWGYTKTTTMMVLDIVYNESKTIAAAGKTKKGV